MNALSMLDIARFWSKAEVRGTQFCWEWKAKTSANGYGRFSIGASYYGAHRVALALHLGTYDRIASEGPNDLVLHICDNRKCVNPFHLRYGTSLENQQDCADRGRMRRCPSRGEQNGRAVLTNEAVRKIRRDSRQALVIANEYGVSRSTIYRIRRGEAWLSTKTAA